jgi:hypothetical protein
MKRIPEREKKNTRDRINNKQHKNFRDGEHLRYTTWENVGSFLWTTAD